MRRNEVDWSGLKFKIAEEMGDSMDVPWVFFDEKNDQYRYHLMNHQDYDGVGGVTKLLEQYDFTWEKMPEVRDQEPPSFFRKLFLLKQFVDLTKKVDLRWKKRTYITGRPEGFFTIFFTKELTDELVELSKKNGANLTARGLATLDRAVCEQLLEMGSERKWVSPINMRTADPKQNGYGNVAASMMMNFRGEVSDIEVTKMMKSYLKKRLHWGSLLYTNMAKWIGLRGTRYIASKIKDVGTGVFSNMGNWPQKTYYGDIEGRARDFCLSPAAPASQVLPVATTCCFWLGKMALNLQIHPCLQMSEIEQRLLLDRWLELLCNGNKTGMTIKYHHYRDVLISGKWLPKPSTE